MKAQLANEFYTWLLGFTVMIADAGFCGFCLLSKSENPHSMRSKLLNDPDWSRWRGWLWFTFIFSAIAAFCLFFKTVEAHSAWVAYVPYWRR